MPTNNKKIFIRVYRDYIYPTATLSRSKPIQDALEKGASDIYNDIAEMYKNDFKAPDIEFFNVNIIEEKDYVVKTKKNKELDIIYVGKAAEVLSRYEIEAKYGKLDFATNPKAFIQQPEVKHPETGQILRRAFTSILPEIENEYIRKIDNYTRILREFITPLEQYKVIDYQEKQVEEEEDDIEIDFDLDDEDE